MKIFQDFYALPGRLPLSNSLLVVTDGDAPPDEKVNLRQLYDLYRNTKSRGLVSLPFLGLIQYYLEENNQNLIKNAISELYYNLGYETLSGARNFNFDVVSDLTETLSFLLKHASLGNKKLREIENESLAKKINDGRTFEPKRKDPLDDVFEIIDLPDVQHKKIMHPYVEPTVQIADEIDKTQEIIDTDFIDLKTLFNKPRDVATENKKNKKIETLINDVTNEKNQFNTFDDFWWEEDISSKKDSPQTTEQSKEILDEINEMSENILRNIRSVDNRTIQERADDQFIPIDDRTLQELKDDDNICLESDNETANPEAVTLIDDNYLSSESDNEIDTPPPAKPDNILKPTTVTLEKINEISDNILGNIKPVDNRTKQELIDNQFIPFNNYKMTTI